MRIVIDTSVMVGAQKEGLGYYLYYLLDALGDPEVAGGHDIVVISPRIHRDVFPIRGAHMRRVTIPSCFNYPLLNIFWFLLGLPVCLVWLKADVFHLADFRRLMLWAPCRVVSTVHDMVNWRLKKRVAGLRRLYHALLRPLFMAQAETFITVSENSRIDMIEYGFPADKIAVIHNGVSPDFHPRPQQEAQQKLSSFAGLPSRFVLCVSRWEHPQKNHVTLLRAWSLLAETGWKLVLVGRKWWNWEVVQEVIDKMDRKGDVLHYDYVPAENLAFFYNAAEFFVFPSLYEGFGFPVVEAMASGLPVIAAESSSVTEIARGAAELFPPQDHAALARIIERWMRDPQERENWRQKGLERARRFSWNESALRHREVLEGPAAPDKMKANQFVSHVEPKDPSRT